MVINNNLKLYKIHRKMGIPRREIEFAPLEDVATGIRLMFFPKKKRNATKLLS
jgi:hypothetical protein